MTEYMIEELRQDERFIRRAFGKGVWPCMLSILSGNLNILADGVLVGRRVGTDGLAAINLCVPVYLLLCIVGSFLVSGAAIQTTKAIGRQQDERAQALYSLAILYCVIASVGITLAGVLAIRPLAALLCMGAEPVLQQMVAQYTYITLLGALPKILIYVPFWYLRIDGRAGVVTCMMTIMGVGNIVLDLLFLYPLNWGIAGAAWASVISTAAACVVGFLCLRSPRSSFHFHPRKLPEHAVWREIALDGSPSALNNLFQTLRLFVVNALLMTAGGSSLVAAFTAINCISAFSLCVVDGVPQAASAMLGVYCAEHDNDSATLLIRQEWRTGALCSAAFSAIIILAADWIAALYGLDTPLRFAMICLAAGMFPALWCSILSSYYNVSGRVLWANLIILSRVFLAAGGCLYLTVALGRSPWWFLFFSEVLTLALWCVGCALFHRAHPGYTRYLQMDRALEGEGCVINFSVAGDDESICEASAKISAFCEANEMNPKQSMRISLSIEEIMTMIVQANPDMSVSFDVRVFYLPEGLGIRIRYNGTAYDPFQDGEAENDAYLGIRMISSLVQETRYQRTFGVNTVQIMI